MKPNPAAVLYSADGALHSVHCYDCHSCGMLVSRTRVVPHEIAVDVGDFARLSCKTARDSR